MTAGLIFSQRLKLRCRQLELTIQFIERVETEIRYTASPCEEIIRHISQDERFAELKFLTEFCNTPSSGRSFASRFQSAVDASKGWLCQQDDDTDKLKEFSSDMGLTDVEGQIKNCELYRGILEGSLKEAEEQKNKKCSLYRSLSVMGAAAAAVIMI